MLLGRRGVLGRAAVRGDGLHRGVHLVRGGHRRHGDGAAAPRAHGGAAIASVDRELEKAAFTLGRSEWRTAIEVTLPLARNGILAGLVLAFARALGEFGATLMLAGNIPGKTQTVPLSIYTAVQTGETKRGAGAGGPAHAPVLCGGRDGGPSRSARRE